MAPRPDLITTLGHEMLDMIPPVLREDPDTVAVIHCYAKEAERLEATIEEVRAAVFPVRAGLAGLQAWARLLRIPLETGTDVAALREAVLRRLRALNTDPSGASWFVRVNRRLGEIPWTYEEHSEGDETTYGAATYGTATYGSATYGSGSVSGPTDSPPAQVIRVHLPYTAGTAAWTNALTVFREETPSELGLIFVSAGGFILDQSRMDQESMTI